MNRPNDLEPMASVGAVAPRDESPISTKQAVVTDGLPIDTPCVEGTLTVAWRCPNEKCDKRCGADSPRILAVLFQGMGIVVECHNCGAKHGVALKKPPQLEQPRIIMPNQKHMLSDTAKRLLAKGKR